MQHNERYYLFFIPHILPPFQNLAPTLSDVSDIWSDYVQLPLEPHCLILFFPHAVVLRKTCNYILMCRIGAVTLYSMVADREDEEISPADCLLSQASQVKVNRSLK